MLKQWLSVGAMTIACLVVASSARASQIGFTLTEVNSLTLTSTLPGLVITPVGTDLWTVDFGASPIAQFFGGGTQMAWVEPNNPTTVNYLNRINGTLFSFQSDMPIGQLPQGLICGATPAPLPLGVSCLIGADVAGNTYFVAVNDNSDAPTAVPEPASMVLLGTGLAGIWVRRRRNCRT